MTNNENFQKNYEWSKKFNNEIIKHLEIYFPDCKFVKGEIEEDRNKCCDFKAVNREIIISARIRDFNFFPKHINDILLSTTVAPNGKTEIDKIVEGNANYYFYGFAAQNDIDILYWRIYDLNIFRLWLHRLILKTGELPAKLNNLECIPFNIKEVENDIIVAYGGRNKNNGIRISNKIIQGDINDGDVR